MAVRVLRSLRWVDADRIACNPDFAACQAACLEGVGRLLAVEYVGVCPECAEHSHEIGKFVSRSPQAPGDPSVLARTEQKTQENGKPGQIKKMDDGMKTSMAYQAP